ncbi:hypothetical protein PC123_g24721 [Phytophthora cactorum]|nr:hypothetical protein PC123_g24721 [Phytophthora cactorum]
MYPSARVVSIAAPRQHPPPQHGSRTKLLITCEQLEKNLGVPFLNARVRWLSLLVRATAILILKLDS